MEAVILDKLMETVMEKLIDTGIEYLKDQFRWQTGMKEELERLRGIQFTKIQAVVAYASTQLEIKDQNPALNTWLCLLRNAMDEVEDLLDVFEHMKLEKQLAKKKSKASSFTGKILKVGQRVLKNDPNLKRLEEVVRKFDKVSDGLGDFRDLVQDAKQEQREQQVNPDTEYETARFPRNSQIIGRGMYMEKVLGWVSDPSNEKQTGRFDNICLKSIVGPGGMGKTTLVQHVLDDDRTQKFDFKMWVYVSDKFDVNRVIARMLNSLERPPSPSDALDKLVSSLQSALKSKKFLLVLDDIWNDDDLRDKLNNVLSPLSSCGSLGSKILVTTRMEHVALTIASVMGKKNEPLKLEGLNEDECLELLNNHAFASVGRSYYHEKLRPIAKEIVKNLSGSPLVAKVIGGNLNSNMDEKYWKRVLNSYIGSETPLEDKVLNVLKRSYITLTKPQQICFAFCSIFLRNHEFDKDDLVRMWIALGFIHPPSARGKTVEDIGGDYFNVLFKKSLLEKFEAEDRTYYKMHDLIHGLARSVSEQECLSIVDDERWNLDNPESIRHLLVKTSKLEVLINTKKYKNLRSLVLYYEGKDDLDVEIFKAWRSIRLLYIYAPNQKLTLPIGHLIHLRYLKLVKTSVTLLPNSLSNLYFLRFLIYDKKFWSFHENFLPRDINNLNLRHLQLPWDKFPVIHEIGKLSHLQRLDGFYVKNEIGHRMEELGQMNNLCQLSIKQLENVKDVGEACSAILCDKKKLTDLSLEWGHVELRINEMRRENPIGLDKKIPDELISLNENVLDNLQPHNKLKKLRISGYMGARSAIWMNDAKSIPNIQYIQLDHCLQWQTLPPFRQFPVLKSLYLRNMQKVKSLGNKFRGEDCVFPLLEVLHIEKLEELEFWFDPAAAATTDYLFPCLIKLYLKDCPNLLELPYLPRKLKVLEIDNIGWKALNWLQDLSSCKISIQNCCNFTENVQLMHSELTINDPSVLLMDPLKRITSLEKLTIKDNDELVSFSTEAEQWFQKVSSSLCELDLDSLKSLQSLPSCLRSLSSLKILRVYDVPQLQELPHLPPSLKDLTIKKCHPELIERYKENVGTDWPKIARIHRIDISNDQ